MLFAFTGMTAQEEIFFRAVAPAQKKELGKEVSNLLESKVSQILNRNGAASEGKYGVFVVQPSLFVTGSEKTSGMVQNINVVSGEFVLTAKNSIDNSEFYSVTVPVKYSGKDVTTSHAELLAKSIKVTDPVYVRFVRTARKNVSEYYENNCEMGMSRALALFNAGKGADALSLLLAIPPTAPCASDAEGLIGVIRQAEVEREEKEKENNPTDSVANDTGKKFPANKKVDSDGEEEEGVGLDEETSEEDSEPDVFISEEGWKVKVKECVWLREQRQIRIDLAVTSEKKVKGEFYTVMTRAISGDGDTYSDWKNNGGRFYFSFPDGVPVKISFLINDILSNPGSLALIEFKVGNLKVELRNVTVK